MTLDMTQEIIDIITSGDVDDDLEEIKMVVYARMALKGGQKRADESFKVGAVVKVNAKLRPNYLFGHTFVVKKINAKTVVVDIPDDPKYRRFSGNKNVRIPKNALVIVG